MQDGWEQPFWALLHPKDGAIHHYIVLSAKRRTVYAQSAGISVIPVTAVWGQAQTCAEPGDEALSFAVLVNFDGLIGDMLRHFPCGVGAPSHGLDVADTKFGRSRRKHAPVTQQFRVLLFEALDPQSAT